MYREWLYAFKWNNTFLEYAGVDPEMDTLLFAPTLVSLSIWKQNYFIRCVSVDPEMYIA